MGGSITTGKYSCSVVNHQEINMMTGKKNIISKANHHFKQLIHPSILGTEDMNRLNTIHGDIFICNPF
jgi:hypothetical protein